MRAVCTASSIMRRIRVMGRPFKDKAQSRLVTGTTLVYILSSVVDAMVLLLCVWRLVWR